MQKHADSQSAATRNITVTLCVADSKQAQTYMTSLSFNTAQIHMHTHTVPPSSLHLYYTRLYACFMK